MEAAFTWVLPMIGVTFAAELIAGRHRGVYKANDYLVNGLCTVLGVSFRPVVALIVSWVIALCFSEQKGVLAPVDFWVALPGILIVGEFANYWVHRLSHELRGKTAFEWLWRLHRTHHTGKYVNVLLNFRISLFWALVSPLSWVTGLALYLGLDKAAAVALVVFSLWGIVTHSDFRWDDPIRRHEFWGKYFIALEHIFVSPGIHHSHHGFGRDGGNYRNFGIFLSVFDWIFGTLHIPSGRPSRYGLPEPTPHWAEEVFFPLYIGAKRDDGPAPLLRTRVRR